LGWSQSWSERGDDEIYQYIATRNANNKSPSEAEIIERRTDQKTLRYSKRYVILKCIKTLEFVDQNDISTVSLSS